MASDPVMAKRMQAEAAFRELVHSLDNERTQEAISLLKNQDALKEAIGELVSPHVHRVELSDGKFGTAFFYSGRLVSNAHVFPNFASLKAVCLVNENSAQNEYFSTLESFHRKVEDGIPDVAIIHVGEKTSRQALLRDFSDDDGVRDGVYFYISAAGPVMLSKKDMMFTQLDGREQSLAAPGLLLWKDGSSKTCANGNFV
jgi:hypothetical protein